MQQNSATSQRKGTSTVAAAPGTSSSAAKKRQQQQQQSAAPRKDATAHPSTASNTPTVTPNNTASSSSANYNRAPSSPPFGYLILAALDALGVTYITLDHLRKAKKGTVNEREYLELWQLLHDLVLVVLADFDVDVDVMRHANDPHTLDATLYDSDAQRIRMELVRFYLYEWGFVCRSFYATSVDTSAPAATDVLLAIAWVLAFGAFLERLQQPILERCCLDASQELFVLPPYPNDTVLTPAQRHAAVATALATTLQHVGVGNNSNSNRTEELTFAQVLQALFAAHGRLESYKSDLVAVTRYHKRLQERLQTVQQRRGVTDTNEELLPAFVLQLLAQPRASFQRYVQLLAMCIKIVEDEKLFFKWINTLVVARSDNRNSSSDNASIETTTASAEQQLPTSFPALATALERVDAADVTASCKHVAKAFEAAWRAVRRNKRPAHVQRVTQSMERFALDVNRRELRVDPSTLFLQSHSTSKAATDSGLMREDGWTPNTSTLFKPLPSELELASLQRQLERVITEIATEYCDAALL